MNLYFFFRSGLPLQNGDRHAVEVTNCAMDLLSFVTQFKVPHLPDYTLQIRIGECGLLTGFLGNIDEGEG